MAVKGVDISEMNGSVDFSALKTAGVEFVIIRCGYGGDYLHQDDERFAENVHKADMAGMPWGAYLYSYAKNTNMARDEAQHTLRLLNGRKPAYGVWYDVEDAQLAGCDLVSICEAYCGAIETAGCYCGIYSMLSWLNGKLNSSRLDKYDKWVADWDTSCGYRKPYGIWQYSDKGVIGGKAFDMNLAYKDYPALTGKKEEDKQVDSYEEFKKHMERYRKEFQDNDSGQWSDADKQWAIENGIIVGSGTTKDGAPNYMWEDFLTREQAVALLHRLEKKLKPE